MICCDAARVSVCVGVPAEVAAVPLVSEVSPLTVTLYAADEDPVDALADGDVSAAWLITLMLRTTGGEFCGR